MESNNSELLLSELTHEGNAFFLPLDESPDMVTSSVDTLSAPQSYSPPLSHLPDRSDSSTDAFIGHVTSVKEVDVEIKSTAPIKQNGQSVFKIPLNGLLFKVCQVLASRMPRDSSVHDNLILSINHWTDNSKMNPKQLTDVSIILSSVGILHKYVFQQYLWFGRQYLISSLMSLKESSFADGFMDICNLVCSDCNIKECMALPQYQGVWKKLNISSFLPDQFKNSLVAHITLVSMECTDHHTNLYKLSQIIVKIFLCAGTRAILFDRLGILITECGLFKSSVFRKIGDIISVFCGFGLLKREGPHVQSKNPGFILHPEFQTELDSCFMTKEAQQYYPQNSMPLESLSSVYQLGLKADQIDIITPHTPFFEVEGTVSGPNKVKLSLSTVLNLVNTLNTSTTLSSFVAPPMTQASTVSSHTNMETDYQASMVNSSTQYSPPKFITQENDISLSDFLNSSLTDHLDKHTLVTGEHVMGMSEHSLGIDLDELLVGSYKSTPDKDLVKKTNLLNTPQPQRVTDNACLTNHEFLNNQTSSASRLEFQQASSILQNGAGQFSVMNDGDPLSLAAQMADAAPQDNNLYRNQVGNSGPLPVMSMNSLATFPNQQVKQTYDSLYKNRLFPKFPRIPVTLMHTSTSPYNLSKPKEKEQNKHDRLKKLYPKMGMSKPLRIHRVVVPPNNDVREVSSFRQVFTTNLTASKRTKVIIMPKRGF